MASVFFRGVWGPALWLLRRLGPGARAGVLGVGLLAVWGSAIAAGAGLPMAWGLAIVLGLSWLYLWGAASLALHRDLQAAGSVLDQALSGNFQQALPPASTGDGAALALKLEMLLKQFSAVVASVRSEAELLAMAGGQLAQTSGSLSDRTEQQAASLEETSATVSQLADGLRGNSGDMREVAAMAQQVMQRAEEGRQVVQSTVSSMNAMAARAGKMTEIIDAINGIAFQTNILALNAAVEAARAGEAGRGFAVVATEVRTLSGRSAKSAAEISELIKGSIDDALAGVRQINETHKALAHVVDHMRVLATKVGGVSTSISEQSTHTQEIAQVIHGLDDITQRNADLVEVSTQSSASLSAQAANLAGSVVSMKLRQGCADEARALVEAATQLILQHGLDAAVRQFHDRSSRFFDRDLFIIVLDRKGYFRAFGMDPTKANKPSVAAPGVDLEALNRITRELADQGGGWAQFRGMHPVTKLPCDKMAYVLPAGPELMVLCSINKNDGSEPTQALRLAA